MKPNLPIIFWTRKFWKIRPFDYNQDILLIVYTNARFQSIETRTGFGTKFARNYMKKKLEKINIKIVISI